MTIRPQRRDEICSGVMVVKTERTNCMRARLNPLLFFNCQSATKLRIGERSTTRERLSKRQNRVGSIIERNVGEIISINRSGAHPNGMKIWSICL